MDRNQTRVDLPPPDLEPCEITLEQYHAYAPEKFELLGGYLFLPAEYPEPRQELLKLLLVNVGLREAVRMAPKALRQEALERVYRDDRAPGAGAPPWARRKGRVNVRREVSSVIVFPRTGADSCAASRFIPEYTPSVKVSGTVKSPGSVLWRQGANLSYYVSAAGGYAQQARKGQVSVRFANGEVRTRRRSIFGGGDPTPGPGSEVFVPLEDPNAKKTDYVSLFGAIAQVVASTIAIIVVVRR